MSKVTLQDVANESGLSVSTVHRALNNKGDVSEKTFNSIMETAVELGYCKKAAMTGSQQSVFNTHVIGLVLMNSPLELLKTPLNARFLSHLESLLAKQGLLTAIVQIHDPETVPMFISPDRMDGMIILGMPFAGNHYPRLKNLNAVHVFAPGNWNELSVDIVTSDYWMRGAMAANYLIDRGHKRIAYLNFQKPQASLNSVGQAFMAAAKERNVEAELFTSDIEVDIQAIMKQHVDSKAVEEDVMSKLLALPPSKRPTGIYVANDQMVVEVYDYLIKHGIKPMVDIDIISSDNEEVYLSQLSPRPATIELHVEEIARQAVETLIARIKKSNPSSLKHRVLIPPSIIEGDL